MTPSTPYLRPRSGLFLRGPSAAPGSVSRAPPSAPRRRRPAVRSSTCPADDPRGIRGAAATPPLGLSGVAATPPLRTTPRPRREPRAAAARAPRLERNLERGLRDLAPLAERRVRLHEVAVDLRRTYERDPASDYPRGSRGGVATRPRTIHSPAVAANTIDELGRKARVSRRASSGVPAPPAVPACGGRPVSSSIPASARPSRLGPRAATAAIGAAKVVASW